MRQALVIVLTLAVIAIGVGVFVYSAGWLATASLSSTETLSTNAAIDSTVNSVAAPEVEQAGAAAPISGADSEGELATFRSQGQDGLCDHDKSASAAGY